MAHRQARDQLIEIVGRKQTQAATGPCAIASEVHNRAEMGVGVVMPANGLIGSTHHRPAALDVQLHLALVKAQSRDVGLGLLSDGSYQGLKQWLTVRQLQRIELQLNPGQGQGEKGLKVHAGAGQAKSKHKKTGPEGPVSA